MINKTMWVYFREKGESFMLFFKRGNKDLYIDNNTCFLAKQENSIFIIKFSNQQIQWSDLLCIINDIFVVEESALLVKIENG